MVENTDTQIELLNKLCVMTFASYVETVSNRNKKIYLG